MSALDPQPAPVEAELVVRFADGSRIITRYLPEPDGHLKIELVQVEPDPVEVFEALLAARTGVYRPIMRTMTHRVTVEQVGQYEIEHLVRRSPAIP